MSDADYIKGACIHCQGRISFPTAALGSTIACPHCSKPTPLTDPNAAPSDTIKGACGSCSGRISFPAAAAGSTSACPHCGEPTVLAGPGGAPSPAPATPTPVAGPGPGRAPAPATRTPQRQIYKARIPTPNSGKGKMIAFVSVGAVALIAVCVGVTLMIVKKGDGGGSGGPGGSGLELVSHELQKAAEGGLIYVVGVVTNHDPEQYFNVKVEFDLFDSEGQPLGDAQDFNSNMAANTDWEFKALALEESVSSVKPKANGGVSGEKASEAP